jgi:hypothetical protein
MYRTPWIGLAALVAMFIIPFLPSWLFDGPRTIKHWPRRHVCGVCGAPWSDEHTCALEADLPGPTLRGELRRLGTAGNLSLSKSERPATESGSRATTSSRTGT